MFLMTITLELVAVIFLGWLQPRKAYVPVIFVPPYSKIVLRLSNDAHPVKFFTKSHAPTLLYCIPLLLLAPFPNGALILCNVILPQSGGTVISSLSLIISLNGLRLCLHFLTMNILHLSLFLTTSSLTLVSHKTLSLIKAHIFKTR
jgi:hypothetical protein